MSNISALLKIASDNLQNAESTLAGLHTSIDNCDNEWKSNNCDKVGSGICDSIHSTRLTWEAKINHQVVLIGDNNSGLTKTYNELLALANAQDLDPKVIDSQTAQLASQVAGQTAKADLLKNQAHSNYIAWITTHWYVIPISIIVIIAIVLIIKKKLG